ncbi:MAG: chalcone isomerase [Oceanospirillaceae bacterium]|nr:chalcone isomerase [Oceanospirillaceae bacterium]MBT10764.1 chalcone isomerase [Oceanospirillaceae bacterium]|tara:strand:+ start:181758 stop:182318 length:561 start_codon:yes stop_codon:yes gene_type:complete
MIRTLTALLVAVAFSASLHATEINDVDIDDVLSAGNQELVLNGAGTRSKFFFDVYVAALYLKNSHDDAQAIIDADEPMAIRLYITSDLITSERMANSTRDGFVRSTDGNIAPIEDKIEELIKAFKDDIEEGDVFDLVYTPEAGVTVYKDGDVESSVQGLAFKKALFGIWLSDNPIQKSLRKALVNR